MKTHGAGKIHGKLCEKFGQLVTERRPSWQIVITLPTLQLDFSENECKIVHKKDCNATDQICIALTTYTQFLH